MTLPQATKFYKEYENVLLFIRTVTISTQILKEGAVPNC